MNEAKPNGDVTICVVHYRTPELVCLDCFSERSAGCGAVPRGPQVRLILRDDSLDQ